MQNQKDVIGLAGANPLGEHRNSLCSYNVMSASNKLFRANCVLACVLAFIPMVGSTAVFESDWDGEDRPWVGPDYWAGPLQDWRLREGRLECFVSGGNRMLFLTTCEATEGGGGYELSVTLGRIGTPRAQEEEHGWAGFRFGIKGALPDYRHAALFGKGSTAGVRTDGTVFIGGQVSGGTVDPGGEVALTLSVARGQAKLVAKDKTGKTAEVTADLKPGASAGHFALISHRDAQSGNQRRGEGSARGGDVRFWFDDWRVIGPQIAAHESRAWGPILWTQYTLSRGVLKMNAQLAPLGTDRPKYAALTFGGKTVKAPIDPLSETATFRVEKWQDKKNHDYTVSLPGFDQTWSGTVRRDPVDKEEIVLAGFTGNTDYIFPDSTLVRNVTKQDPDVLFFSGDQLYENVAGYGIQRTWDMPVETVALDYLRKWYLVGWAWKDLLKDRPSVFLPDDHDVYQGNIWGANGRASQQRGGFDDGGYGMDPAWVNAVQRTQCAHLPDPYDPTPILQGITVYYGDFNYGRISFAMIEDRKFKTGPRTVLPAKGGRADHVRPQDVDPETWDPLSLDVPEAVLLGERQLNFLDSWAADWTKADFKCVLSQTIFCNLANYHGGNKQYLIADLDSNGWPQSGRKSALRAMRRGFAFHCAGDQHLPSIVQHGINDWGDSGYSFCVPSISAGYPRSWLPDLEGLPVRNRPELGLPNTGEYRDGLGNLVTVYAIGNPEEENRTNTRETLGHDKASGHGIVRFNRETREITMECWRLLVDVDNPRAGDQFPGWPKTIKLEDNYGREAGAWLPTLKIKGMDRPVVQVIDESNGEIVYTLRIGGNEFRPKVYTRNTHAVLVGELGEGRFKKLINVETTEDEKATIEIDFE
jgi:phosphodiesterase/alkaline phosphatase D-like protein